MQSGLIFHVSQRWQRVREIARVLSLVRFNLLVTLVGVIIVWVDQGQEALRAMAEALAEGWRAWARLAGFLLVTFVASLSVWYFARVIFRFRFADWVTAANYLPHFKAHLPRFLGAAVPVLTAAAVWTATKSLWLYMAVLAVAVLVLVFVYARRRLLGMEAWEEERRDLTSFRELAPATRRIVGASLLANVVVMIIFTIFPHTLGGVLSAPTVVLIGLALLVPTGSMLVYWGEHARVPVISALLGAAILFSLFNDNHRVRQNATMHSFEDYSAQRTGDDNTLRAPSLDDYFADWFSDLDNHDPAAPVPVIVVAAEGGGIRAAFWTASVLTELQQRDPSFARHVFAISGVSGGSLGAAMFAALIKSEQVGYKPRPTVFALCGDAPTLRCRAQAILAQDFLSPTVVTLMFPDTLQRFLPIAVLDDRAVTLEESWQKAWNRYEDGNWFEEPFNSLWHQDRHEIPLLFLNSTVVETGQRIIANPLGLGERFADVFHDALEAGAAVGHDMPLSTAVHLGARFTYVSPAGSIQRQDMPEPKPWIRVVDGGYFENSGAVTANEILTRIMSSWNACHRRSHDACVSPIRPIIVHISNDPIFYPVAAAHAHVIMSELLSPVRALLRVRPARGYQARAELAHHVREYGGDYAHFRLCKLDVPLPLGWMLSRKAQSEMTRQLLENQPPAAYNAWALYRVMTLLRGGQPDPSAQTLEPCRSTPFPDSNQNYREETEGADE